MKNSIHYIFCLLFLLGAISCEEPVSTKVSKEDGFTITETQIGTNTFYVVQGDIRSSYTFTENKLWVLEGAVKVHEGATLTIEAGTTIYGAFNENTAYLAIEQGAKIEAVGTFEKPITLTTIRKLTSIPQPGDWGGLIINGKAPINLEGGIGIGEGGSGNYGGNEPDDNSGTLQYVIVEYGGSIIGENEEMNNISFNGCGRGTTVNYIEALYGNDDGIEIFGGTINIKHAISFGNGDDSFDWSLGWIGMGQYWLIVQDPYNGDRGIEADNNEDNYMALPTSNPTISNVTIIGAEDDDQDNTGITLRHGTKGKIYNLLITDFPKYGIEVKDSATNYLKTNEVIVENSVVFKNGLVSPEGADIKNSEISTLPSNSTKDPFILSGYLGVIEGAGKDPSTLDSWFDANTYIGAVPANNDWTGWADKLR